jgi:asparagine synthase (glutamine-hydrolysing)
MCGFIVALNSPPDQQASVGDALRTIRHRGPDAAGSWASPSQKCQHAHCRLSIVDLSAAGDQPMASRDGRYTIVFNGEIYNHVELRRELAGRVDFRTATDTEVLLAAFEQWGEACLERLIGMFAFAIWDERTQALFAARDRFGVKPLFLHRSAGGGLLLASEIKALHSLGVPRRPNAHTWATYLKNGLYDHGVETFWDGVEQLPPGCSLWWTAEEGARVRPWYDVATVLERGPDTRGCDEVGEELLSLLEDSVRLRFRADVQVGICLSGGLDSNLLLSLVDRMQGPDSEVKTFTFYCGDPVYDETPSVRHMLSHTRHPGHFCRLRAEEVPQLAARSQRYQDEPFGGVPTLGMAKVHERARDEGVTVLLDGNGMDEGWAGYEYYARANCVEAAQGPVQGSRSGATSAACLEPDFAALARPFSLERSFGDPLRDLQYRDLRHAKIPRAMRFADRVSMMFSRELREPFLDHRIVELGFAQPSCRKVRDGQGKWLPRQIAARLIPADVREAPKRPVQTPQREWLRGPLAGWVEECLDSALSGFGEGWLNPPATRAAWETFRRGEGDNSFPVWQWISLGLIGAQN